MPIPTDVIVDEIFPQVFMDGTGVLKDFPFSFWIPDDASLLVYLKESGVFQRQLINTDYTVSRAVEPAVGGTLNFLSAPALDSGNIVIMRRVKLERITDFLQGSALRAQVLNLDLDRIVTMIQDLERLALQSVRVADFENIATLSNEIPLNPGELIRVNSTGDGFDTTDFVSRLGVIHQDMQTPQGDDFFLRYQIKDPSGSPLAIIGQVVELRLSVAATLLQPIDAGPTFELGVSGLPLAGLGTASLLYRADSSGVIEPLVKANGYSGPAYVWVGQGIGSSSSLSTNDFAPWEVNF